MKRDDIYKYNGLKSPLWGGLFSPLFSPFEGSALSATGEADPGNTILQEDSFDILQEDNTYILQEA